MALLTVLMSIHKKDEFLADAIRSILNQNYRNFEFIIIDDGANISPSDPLISDNRIRLIINGSNKGLAYSLNRGIQASTAPYIIRMDADDISNPDRFSAQLKFMKDNPSVDICGSWIETFGSQKGIWRYPLTDQEIKAHSLFANPLAHPSVILKKAIFIEKNIFYDESLLRSQDYELWSRCICSGFKFANIPAVLLKYRLHPYQTGAVYRDDQIKVNTLVYSYLLEKLGVVVNHDLLTLHNSISLETADDLEAVGYWLAKILKNNNKAHFFDQRSLRKILNSKFLNIFLKNNTSSLGSYFKSPYRNLNQELDFYILKRLFLRKIKKMVF